jgi:hypothetical protein
MNITHQNNAVFCDGLLIREFPAPVDAAILRDAIVLVILFGPIPPPVKYLKDDLEHPERYEESNRNVYGMTPNGEVLWRVQSIANPAIPNKSFSRILIAGDLTLLETYGGAYYQLEPKTGEIKVYPAPQHSDVFYRQLQEKGEVSFHPRYPKNVVFPEGYTP